MPITRMRALRTPLHATAAAASGSCSLSLCPLTSAALAILQIGYGATILSFLGGVHWGLAMTNVGGEPLFLMAQLMGRKVGQKLDLGREAQACAGRAPVPGAEPRCAQAAAELSLTHHVCAAGDTALKLADQRYLWSVVPCLMGWPTVAMPLGHAAGIQVSNRVR